MILQAGDDVLIRSKRVALLWNGSVVDVATTDDTADAYLVEYSGWGAPYREWVAPDRVLSPTPANMQIQVRSISTIGEPYFQAQSLPFRPICSKSDLFPCRASRTNSTFCTQRTFCMPKIDPVGGCHSQIFLAFCITRHNKNQIASHGTSTRLELPKRLYWPWKQLSPLAPWIPEKRVCGVVTAPRNGA